MTTITTKTAKNGATIYYADGKRISAHKAFEIRFANEAEARKSAVITKLENIFDAYETENGVKHVEKGYTAIIGMPYGYNDGYTLEIIKSVCIERDYQSADEAINAVRYFAAKADNADKQDNYGYVLTYKAGQSYTGQIYYFTLGYNNYQRYEPAYYAGADYDESAFDLLPDVDEVDDVEEVEETEEVAEVKAETREAVLPEFRSVEEIPVGNQEDNGFNARAQMHRDADNRIRFITDKYHGNYTANINGERVLFKNFSIVGIDATRKFDLTYKNNDGKKSFKWGGRRITRAKVAEIYIDSELAKTQRADFHKFFDAHESNGKFFDVNLSVTLADGNNCNLCKTFDKFSEAQKFVEELKGIVKDFSEYAITIEHNRHKDYRNLNGTETYDLPDVEFFKGYSRTEIQARVDELNQAIADNELVMKDPCAHANVWEALCIANHDLCKTRNEYEFFLHTDLLIDEPESDDEPEPYYSDTYFTDAAKALGITKAEVVEKEIGFILDDRDELYNELEKAEADDEISQWFIDDLKEQIADNLTKYNELNIYRDKYKPEPPTDDTAELQAAVEEKRADICTARELEQTDMVEDFTKELWELTDKLKGTPAYEKEVAENNELLDSFAAEDAEWERKFNTPVQFNKPALPVETWEEHDAKLRAEIRDSYAALNAKTPAGWKVTSELTYYPDNPYAPAVKYLLIHGNELAAAYDTLAEIETAVNQLDAPPDKPPVEDKPAPATFKIGKCYVDDVYKDNLFKVIGRSEKFVTVQEMYHDFGNGDYEWGEPERRKITKDCRGEYFSTRCAVELNTVETVRVYAKDETATPYEAPSERFLNDSLTCAMNIAHDNYLKFKRAGNHSAAKYEMKLYKICRDAQAELQEVC